MIRLIVPIGSMLPRLETHLPGFKQLIGMAGGPLLNIDSLSVGGPAKELQMYTVRYISMSGLLGWMGYSAFKGM